jgi:hypothetical protein
VHLFNPFDNLQAGLNRMAGNDDIIDPRRLMPIGLQVNKDFIVLGEQGPHGGPCHPVALPTPEQPQEKLFIAASLHPEPL